MRVCLAVLLLAAYGCGPPPDEDADSGEYLEFRLRAAGADRYDAEYTAGGETARFQIELRGQGQGAFVGAANSHPKTFVMELCRLLEAVACPAVPEKREARLAFNYTELVHAATRDDTKQPGSWRYLRVYFGEDEDSEIELLVKLSAKDGLGEFRQRNADAGDALMRRLAKVL